MAHTIMIALTSRSSLKVSVQTDTSQHFLAPMCHLDGRRLERQSIQIETMFGLTRSGRRGRIGEAQCLPDLCRFGMFWCLNLGGERSWSDALPLGDTTKIT